MSEKNFNIIFTIFTLLNLYEKKKKNENFYPKQHFCQLNWILVVLNIRQISHKNKFLPKKFTGICLLGK